MNVNVVGGGEREGGRTLMQIWLFICPVCLFVLYICPANLWAPAPQPYKSKDNRKQGNLYNTPLPVTWVGGF